MATSLMSRLTRLEKLQPPRMDGDDGPPPPRWWISAWEAMDDEGFFSPVQAEFDAALAAYRAAVEAGDPEPERWGWLAVNEVYMKVCIKGTPFAEIPTDKTVYMQWSAWCRSQDEDEDW